METPPRARTPQAVLFACGLNSVRSPMAESLLQQMFPHALYVKSAGVRKGELDPFAVAVMAELGQDISGHKPITSGQKLTFAVIASTLLCVLFPVAAPLFLSLFLGVAVREAGITQFQDLLSNVFLYGATFFLGLTLGVLCEASTLLNPQVLILLLLGMLALLVSGIGGIIGGYVMYFATGGKINPIIGIAGVSCVPTTAKVAQKIATHDNPQAIIMPAALGVSISGVITSAIIAGTFVALLR